MIKIPITKLKNLKLTSVDLVDKGANPDAHIMLYKRKDGKPQQIPANTGGTDESVLKNYAKGEFDTMKINKSKMTAEELEQLVAIEKKYGMPDNEESSESADNEGIKKSSGTADTTADTTTGAAHSTAQELHPVVSKALLEMEQLKKNLNAKDAELSELKKSLEIEKLASFAKKYEILGKKPDELALKLYDVQKAGKSAYNDFISLLDEQVTLIEKSGLMSEIGSNNSGGASDAWGQIQKVSADIAKRDGISKEQAIEKVGIENPELIEAYRREH